MKVRSKLAGLACMALIGTVMLAGCASWPGDGRNTGNGGSTAGSGITVFGTIDAGVSGTRNSSR